MIEREILKDIKDYKPKFIGPLTLRQTVCSGLAIITGVPVALLTGQIFINEIAIVVGGLVGTPFLLCIFEPYGIPFEKFAKQYIRMNILTPKNRKYQTRNYYESFMPIEKKCDMSKKELKKYKKAQKKELKTMGDEFAIIA